MTKTDKKTDKAITQALTQVCEAALEQVPGFEWLTHTVNYKAFPQSLKVVCVFDTLESLGQCKTLAQDAAMVEQILSALAAVNVLIKQPQKQVRFDTEEACEIEHFGNWQKRLAV